MAASSTEPRGVVVIGVETDPIGVDADPRVHARADVCDVSWRRAWSTPCVDDGMSRVFDDELASELGMALMELDRVADAPWEVGRRHLERARQMLSTLGNKVTRTKRVLRVHRDGRWFEIRDGDRVSLGRADAPCRVLRRLIEQRQHSASEGVPWETLFEAGWPEQRIAPASAQHRVYTTIWSLRDRGLGGVILTSGCGYMLDPAVEILVD